MLAVRLPRGQDAFAAGPVAEVAPGPHGGDVGEIVMGAAAAAGDAAADAGKTLVGTLPYSAEDNSPLVAYCCIERTAEAPDRAQSPVLRDEQKLVQHSARLKRT